MLAVHFSTPTMPAMKESVHLHGPFLGQRYLLLQVQQTDQYLQIDVSVSVQPETMCNEARTCVPRIGTLNEVQTLPDGASHLQ